MTDYVEERRSELEVLESIFPDELTIISEDQLSIIVEPEIQSQSDPYILSLIIKYTPQYPDELPEISIETIEGELDEEEEEELVMGLIGAANDSLGMAMVYTLSLHLRESLAEFLKARTIRIRKTEDERIRIAEEAVAIKTAGTKVTVESFTEWKIKFEKEMIETKKKEDNDKLKAMPIKQRDEVLKYTNRLSGRQLFEKDSALITSDAAFEEDGAVQVDASQYERPEDIDDESEDEVRLGDMSDSD